jgi:hypothetical protein
MAMAYRLLCHAEIENHIENSAKAVVLAKAKESKAGTANLSSLSLLAYHRTGWHGLQIDDEEPMLTTKVNASSLFKHPLGKLLDDALSEYIGRVINNNHGVRIDDLHRVLKPTGVDFDCIDTTWLSAMDGFGKSRGFTAHKSSVGVTRPIDPKDELAKIEILVIGLKELDDLLGKLLKSKK